VAFGDIISGTTLTPNFSRDFYGDMVGGVTVEYLITGKNSTTMDHVKTIFSRLLNLPVQEIITKIKEHINSYHNGIDDVKHAYKIDTIFSNFGCYSTAVTKKNKNEERQTFPPGSAGLIRFIDISRPGNTKADNHKGFQ